MATARSALVTSLTVPCRKAVSFSNDDLDVLAGQLAIELLLDGADFGVAGPDRQIEEQAIAALLPDDDAGLAGGLAIHQHFARVDGQRFGHLAVGHRNALNVHRAVDHQRLSHGDEQIARGLRAHFLTRRLRLHGGDSGRQRGFSRGHRRQRQRCKANAERATH